MKYRLIKKVNNAADGFITYIIEKRIRFLFWSWWSTNYLFDVVGCYEFNKLQDALNMIDILNGKKVWYSKTVMV